MDGEDDIDEIERAAILLVAKQITMLADENDGGVMPDWHARSLEGHVRALEQIRKARRERRSDGRTEAKTMTDAELEGIILAEAERLRGKGGHR